MLLALALCVSAVAAAQPASQPAKPAAKPAAKSALKPAARVRPAWAELTAEQQEVLAPLKPDWEKLEPASRAKWIGIAKRYPKMKSAEQERVQKRMQLWANLSPEQRRQARENYKRIAKVPPERRGDLPIDAYLDRGFQSWLKKRLAEQ